MPDPEHPDRLTVTTDLRSETLRDPIRDGLGIAILLIVAGFVSVLPGAGRELPGTDVAIGALLLAVVSMAVVAAIVLATSSVGTLVGAAMRGPPDVVRDFAAAVRYALAFLAVLVAYRGLAPVVVPLLAPDGVWMYDVAFLGSALFPVLAIARRLYRNADVLATDLADAVAGAPSSAPGEPGSQRSGGP